MNQELSVAKGIQIQQHLSEWKIVLKEDVYMKLAMWAIEWNGEARTGYDIRRGSNLSGWVQNY
jgi:hypothetical protein